MVAWRKEDLTEKMSLLYSTPKQGTYEVMVHSPHHLYKMLQSKSRTDRTVDLAAAQFHYSWDAKLLKSLAIPGSDLFCLITECSSRAIVPSAIVPTSLASRFVLGDYQVSVLPNKDVEELRLILQDSNGANLYESQQLRQLPRNIPITLDIPADKLLPGQNKLSFTVTFAEAVKPWSVQKTVIIPSP